MAGRLTDLAGSSAYVLGGLVVYSNEAKTEFADVPAELIAAHGAVSPGGRAGFGCRRAVALRRGRRASGSPASPGRAAGRREKPVGTVCLCVSSAWGVEERVVRLPGSRADVRDRTTTVALHMLRACLPRSGAERLTEGEGSGVCAAPAAQRLRAPRGRAERCACRSQSSYGHRKSRGAVVVASGASTSDRSGSITTALRTKGVMYKRCPERTFVHHPPTSACSFPRDPQEAGGRAWRPTNICQMARTLTESGKPTQPCHAEPGGDVRATRAETPLPSPSMPAVQRLFVALDLPDESAPPSPRSRSTERPGARSPEATSTSRSPSSATAPRPTSTLIAPIIEAEHEAPQLALGNVLRLRSAVLAAEITGDARNPSKRAWPKPSPPPASTPPRPARSART